MSEAVIVAIITGGISLFGTIITVFSTSKATEKKFEVSQAVMEAKIVELTREVREHNGFARRLPVAESQIESLNHRIENLERRSD